MTPAGPPPFATLEDLRVAIDALDGDIVALLARRQALVAEAGRLKPDRGRVRDPARIEGVVAKARAHALARGADPGVIEAIYRAMIEAFIAFEYRAWEAAHVAEDGVKD